jgi:hypothetical protein
VFIFAISSMSFSSIYILIANQSRNFNSSMFDDRIQIYYLVDTILCFAY